jgi:GTP-binding protein Era
MVILDTPGLLEPKDTLHSAMRNAALSAVRDADVLVHVVDATGPMPDSFEAAAQLERAPRAELVLALNKADLLDVAERDALLARYPHGVLMSATSGAGVDDLVSAITGKLPVSPYLYPGDEISTQPVRFFCAEFVRETALEQLGDELPHALACEIEEFREGSSPLYIRAVLHVERDSQKAIVIGANGQQIKKLGRAAREKIERFIGEPVYLDLWVKVLPNWRRKRSAVLRLGYGDPSKRT